ncbi:MAG: hypothetical protein ACLFOY_00450 [Desulfatibacillaceae bacterium]
MSDRFTQAELLAEIRQIYERISSGEEYIWHPVCPEDRTEEIQLPYRDSGMPLTLPDLGYWREVPGNGSECKESILKQAKVRHDKIEGRAIDTLAELRRKIQIEQECYAKRNTDWAAQKKPDEVLRLEVESLRWKIMYSEMRYRNVRAQAARDIAWLWIEAARALFEIGEHKDAEQILGLDKTKKPGNPGGSKDLTAQEEWDLAAKYLRLIYSTDGHPKKKRKAVCECHERFAMGQRAKTKKTKPLYPMANTANRIKRLLDRFGWRAHGGKWNTQSGKPPLEVLDLLLKSNHASSSLGRFSRLPSHVGGNLFMIWEEHVETSGLPEEALEYLEPFFEMARFSLSLPKIQYPAPSDDPKYYMMLDRTS